MDLANNIANLGMVEDADGNKVERVANPWVPVKMAMKWNGRYGTDAIACIASDLEPTTVPSRDGEMSNLARSLVSCARAGRGIQVSKADRAACQVWRRQLAVHRVHHG